MQLTWLTFLGQWLTFLRQKKILTYQRALEILIEQQCPGLIMCNFEVFY